MRFQFVGPSYKDGSNVVSDEECINLLAETIESPGAQTRWVYLRTPGLKTAYTFDDGPTRGGIELNGRAFEASGDTFYEIFADGTTIKRMDGLLDNFGAPISVAATNVELLIVAGGRAWCYNLAANTVNEVTSMLAGIPIMVAATDTYFIVIFQDSNKFQVSGILDGNTWPGIQVSAVSVFPENLSSIIVSHRELWVFGGRHCQPYQDTGSDEIFDVIPGTLIESGNGPLNSPKVLDNTVFWWSRDSRGARQAWRANAYTPSRISTYAVEATVSSYTDDQFANLVSYSYQEEGHLFWVNYIPGTDCTWVYDVAQSLWHKRAQWNADSLGYTPHRSWNHIYAFGKHLVGDWKTGTIFEMSRTFLDDDGSIIRRLRRAPTLVDEMKWIYITDLTVDAATGLGPQAPLTDGDGNPRPPQMMMRFSDNRGSTWSNEQIANCGFAGEYNVRVIYRRLGRTRYRVFEISVSDPIDWVIVDAYLNVANSQ